MSLKLRVKYKYRSLANTLRYWLYYVKLPNWLTSAAARTTLLCLVIVMSVAFVIQSTAVGSGGYQVQSLESKKDALNANVEKLSADLADEQSLATIQARLKDSGMVAAANIFYVKADSDTVVAKK